jgi:hypothetical protein
MEQEWRTAYQDYISAYLDSGVSWNHTDEFGNYGTSGNSGSGSGNGNNNNNNASDKSDDSIIHGYAAKFNGEEHRFMTEASAK